MLSSLVLARVGFAPRHGLLMPACIRLWWTTRDDWAGAPNGGDDGFRVNIGAITISSAAFSRRHSGLLEAPLDIRAPEPASAFPLIDGKVIDVGRGGWSLLLGQLTEQASRILEKFADARLGDIFRTGATQLRTG